MADIGVSEWTEAGPGGGVKYKENQGKEQTSLKVFKNCMVTTLKYRISRIFCDNKNLVFYPKN